VMARSCRPHAIMSQRRLGRAPPLFREESHRRSTEPPLRDPFNRLQGLQKMGVEWQLTSSEPAAITSTIA
jgi:hypothetical protein